MTDASGKKRKSGVKETVLTRSSLRRLAYVAGAQRVAKPSYSHIRNHANKFLGDLLRKVATVVSYAGHSTVQSKDVSLVLKLSGNYVVYSEAKSASSNKVYPAGSGKNRVKPTTSSKRKIKFYQKNSEGLFLPKLNVARIVRRIANEYKVDKEIRFSASAMILIHEVLEMYLLDLLKMATQIGVQFNFSTIMEKHLDLASKLCATRV